MDTKECSVFRPSEASQDTHPHACNDGLVFLTYTVFDEELLTYTVFDEELGDEVERLEVVPCRRCASEAGR